MQNTIKLLLIIINLLIITKGRSQTNENTTKIPLIIDADTANEVDDLYALVRAIKEPKINLLGITSAQFHTSPIAGDSTVFQSQKINEKLITLLGKNDILLPLGSDFPLSQSNKPQDSEAARFIIEKAHEASQNNKLQLVILGSCTNVASAVLLDTTIVPKIRVNYLGFWHDQKRNSYNKKEFNSRNDSLAVNTLLNNKLIDFRVMTATTSQHLVFDKKTVDKKLKGKGGVADYLVNRWETYERWWTKEDPKKLKWVMWDVAIIEALIHPEWAIEKTFETPPENTKRPIQVYTKIDVKRMEKDFWKHFDKLIKQ